MQFFYAIKNLKYILWKSTKLGLVGIQLTIVVMPSLLFHLPMVVNIMEKLRGTSFNTFEMRAK